MTCAGYVWGGAFALGLGAALVAGAGAGAASAESSDGESPSGGAAAATSHSTSTASSRRSVAAKPVGARVSAVPNGVLRPPRPVGQARLPAPRSERQARSLRTAAAVPSGDSVAAAETGGVTADDLPKSYSAYTSTHSFRDGSENVKVTSVYGAENPDAVEFFYLHRDGGNRSNYVAYTQLYLNQDVHIPTSGGGAVMAFDAGVFPSDFGLPEIPAGPPRRLPNSPSELRREDLGVIVSFIPIVGQALGVLSLVQDGIELRDAQQRGDIDDVADEKQDLTVDLVLLPGFQQLITVAAVLAAPVSVPIGVVAVLYIWAINDCKANPESRSCSALG